MLELKQIDENTYSINGRTFKHTGEDVRSPMEQNVAEVKYTKDYCWKNRVAIACLDAIEWEAALGLYNSNVAKENEDEWLVYREKSCFSFDNGEFGFGSTGYYRGAGYTIIPAATFIAHNTPQQDEVLFVTEDDVNIYPSQIFCYVPKENTVIFTEAYEVLPINFFERTKEGKLFSTEQAAQAYINSQKHTYPWQKEFFIEAFQRCDTGYVHDLNIGGTYGPYNASLEDFLFKRDLYISVESENAAIFKIRRISDNAVFTVGDKVQTANDGALEIKGIEICGNSIVFKFAIGSLNATEGQPYKLPTLAEVFKKVQPKWYIDGDNNSTYHVSGLLDYSNRANYYMLSTQSQCTQIQAWMLLRNIADYYNEEAAWFPTKGGVIYSIGYDLAGTFLVETFDFSGDDFIMPLGVAFKQRDHAEQAIEILKEARLLNALKG